MTISPAQSLRRLAKLFAAIVACVVAAVPGARGSESIVQWAPDGAHAIVAGSEGTVVIDPEGAILGKAPDAVVWMPDSRRVLAIHRVKARNWAEVAAVIGPDRANEAAAAARDLEDLVRTYQGDWSKFFDSDGMKRWSEAQQPASADYLDRSYGNRSWTLPIFLLQERNPRAIASLAEQVARDASLPVIDADGVPFFERDDKGGGVFTCSVFELAIRDALPGDASTETPLLRTVDAIGAVRASPNGKLIAFVIAEPKRPALYVIPSEGGGRTRVDSGAAEADWTPDGESLVYAKTAAAQSFAENETTPGSISRCRIFDTRKNSVIAEHSPINLANILYAAIATRVACLPDGRILFAGIEKRFPTIAGDSGWQLNLFLLAPGESPRIRQLLDDKTGKRRQSGVNAFSLSPDGAHAAIPGEDGEATVVTIENGTAKTIQGPPRSGKPRARSSDGTAPLAVAPIWRTANELSFVVPPGVSGAGPKRAEVVLRSLSGDVKVLSKTWPDTMTERFLPRVDGTEK